MDTVNHSSNLWTKSPKFMVMALSSGSLPADKTSPSLSPVAGTAQSPPSNTPDGNATLTFPSWWHHLIALHRIDDESKHIYLDSHLPNQFYFYRPFAGLIGILTVCRREEGWAMGAAMVSGWAWEKGGGGREGLMAFTIFNAEACHHWISILNNVAFHHKFFTTYLLNGKSYGSLSGW